MNEDAPSNDQKSGTLGRLVTGLLAVALFVLGLQLLRGAGETLGPWLKTELRRVISNDASALGASWLGSYLLMNGSVVAAVSLTFFEQAVVDASEVFIMIVGSRLGAAGIVVAVGAVDYFQREVFSLRRACAVGVLAFLVTHLQTIPATLAGYLPLYLAGDAFVSMLDFSAASLPVPPGVGLVSSYLLEAVGPVIAAIGGVALLFAALNLFDRLFDEIDVEAARRRYFRFVRNRWWAFLLGLAVTTLTLSVAFSLSVVVPLYNRGHTSERELIPYILGANIGTMIDTLLVAFLVDKPGALAVVALFLVATALASLLLLVFHNFAEWFAGGLLEWIVSETGHFATYLVSLAVVPALILAVGMLVG